MEMLVCLALSIFTTIVLNRSNDWQIGGTTAAPTRFESFLHGCWLTFFPVAVYVSAHHIFTQTWTISRRGPPAMDLVQYAHSPVSLIPYLALGGMSAWLIATVFHVSWLRQVANGRSRYQWKSLSSAIAVLALYQVPTSYLNHVTLAYAGPGAHPGQWLSYAAATGDQRAVEQLAKQGVAVETLEENGQTALVSATVGNRTDVVKYLLARGADVNARTSRGESPLTIAAYDNNRAIGEMLLKRGAKLPCAGWYSKRLQVGIASRDSSFRQVLADSDSLRTRQALRSDSVLASWAAGHGQNPSPCD